MFLKGTFRGEVPRRAEHTSIDAAFGRLEGGL